MVDLEAPLARVIASTDVRSGSDEQIAASNDIPHWTDDPDYFVWQAFATASAFPSVDLGEGALQQHALLADTDNLYVIPDQFGVVSGHVLILPKERASSIASLGPRYDSEIRWLLRHVSTVVARTYRAQVVVAEHGECGCDTAGQAHIHVLPIPATVSTPALEDAVDAVLRRRMVGVERVLFKDEEFTSPEDIRQLIDHPEAKADGELLQCSDLDQRGVYPAAARTASGLAHPYVYFKGAGIEFTSMSSFRSQFVREVVGNVSGLPHGRWNRRVFVDRGNMFDTFRRLATQFPISQRRFGFSARADLLTPSH